MDHGDSQQGWSRVQRAMIGSGRPGSDEWPELKYQTGDEWLNSRRISSHISRSTRSESSGPETRFAPNAGLNSAGSALESGSRDAGSCPIHLTSARRGRRGRFGRRRSSMHEPNDTQEEPSQVWTTYAESLLKSKDHSKEQTSHNPTPVKLQSTNGIGPHTYATEDDGYVNLAGTEDPYDDADPQPTQIQDGESEDELAAENTQIRDGLVTSPACLPPITPGLAGSKRDARGNVLGPSPAPPVDFSTMFGRAQKKPNVGLSQIFHQTQALSSPPLLGQLKSDPVFERPSPAFRPGHRSSPGPESSPVIPRRAVFQRAITDPRNVYVSMRDSQEHKRQLQEDIQRQLDALEEQDELSQDTEERKAELERQKAAIAQETSNLFKGMIIPSSIKIDRRRKILEPDPNTPAARTGKQGQAILISDDTPRPHVDGADDDVSDAASDTSSREEYDELSQQLVAIPSSSRKLQGHHLVNQRPSSSPAHSNRGVSRDIRDVRQTHTFSGSLKTYSARSSNAENYVPSQTMQVPYSQTNATDSLPPRPPRPVLVSSLDSRTFVSQSQQDFSVISNARAQLENMPVEESSSMPPAPPVPFDDDMEVDGDPVPTSPPSSPPGATTPAAGNFDALVNSKPGASGIQAKVDQAAIRRRGMPRAPDTSPTSTAAKTPKASISVAEDKDPSASTAQPSHSTGQRPSVQRSDSTGVYNTARTQQPALVVSPITPLRHSQVRAIEPSPRKVAGIGKMGLVDLDPTPPDQDVDIFAGIDVLNDEDHEFDALMNDEHEEKQRSNKRSKRVYGSRKALHDPSKEQNKLRSRDLPDTQEVVKVPDAPYSTDFLQEKKITEPVAPEIQVAETVTASKDPAPASTVESSIKPVVSASLQRDLVGINTQWQRRRRTRGQSNANEDPLQRAQSAEVVQHTAQDLRRPPSLEINAAVVETTQAPPYPQRVFARFKDARAAYWPATLLNTDKGLCKVQFDDGNVDDEMPVHLVKPLILRPGFQVRVDDDKYHGKPCVVREMKGATAPTPHKGRDDPKVDAFGHKTITVEVKQRSSTGLSKTQAKIVDIPISKVYIMPSSWKQVPQHASDTVGGDIYGDLSMRLHTPVVTSSVPTTPTSRHRRSTLSTVHPETKHSFKLESKAGLFSNMAFAITLPSKDDGDKAILTRLIRDNGGAVLTDGFDALFVRPSSAVTNGTATPASSDSASMELTLAASTANLGFVALITDTHSRRAKYMEALALDIPCLSTRWIHDSVARQQFLPWPRYLLPAGECTLLDGAVRSRVLPHGSFDATSLRLEQTIKQRSRLLHGKNVIFIVGKDEERNKTFKFLLQALGVARIDPVNLNAARASISVDCDYVFASDGALELAAVALSGQKQTAKRKSKNDTKLSVPVRTASHSYRIIGDEFVIQTLILGALVVED